MQSQTKYEKVFSFELFPPKTEVGMEKLETTITELSSVNPAYFSVTYGAGGSTQERTFETVNLLRRKDIATAPHLSCIGSHREEIAEILRQYQEQDIQRLVALRGDMPSGMGEPGDFRYANELVEFIRAETGDHFHLEVAAYPEFHPQATSAGTDLESFARKVKAGADSAITQYFFNADAYIRFVESCEKLGIDIPIVPGIMPINNYAQLARFSDACGAEIPRWLRKRMEDFGDDLVSARTYGIDVVTELCSRLLQAGAPGLHFYTMNQAELSLAIWKNLGLPEE
jgi:methylenetetrahydrofolate reductase (NADPH)